MSKPFFRSYEARGIADGLLELMSPLCDRIAVAGSLRRGKRLVADIKIVYVPVSGAVDLLLVDLLADGRLEKRANIAGAYTWGAKNKFTCHIPSGLPVDFFATDARCFDNYLFYRTGPADLCREIAERARVKGWRWCPYGGGFEHADGRVHVCGSEAEVFEFVGLEAVGPAHRNDFKSYRKFLKPQNWSRYEKVS